MKLLSPALIDAIVRGNTEIALMLIKHGADVTGKTYEDRPALDVALQWSHSTELLNLILDHGGSGNQSNNHWSPLIRVSRDGNEAFARILLARGADPNGSATMRGLALYSAVDNGHLEIAKLLLEAGADPTIKIADKMTVFDVAKRIKYKPMIQLLNDAIAKRRATISTLKLK